jgi:hypothetical protein
MWTEGFVVEVPGAATARADCLGGERVPQLEADRLPDKDVLQRIPSVGSPP